MALCWDTSSLVNAEQDANPWPKPICNLEEPHTISSCKADALSLLTHQASLLTTQVRQTRRKHDATVLPSQQRKVCQACQSMRCRRHSSSAGITSSTSLKAVNDSKQRRHKRVAVLAETQSSRVRSVTIGSSIPEAAISVSSSRVLMLRFACSQLSRAGRAEESEVQHSRWPESSG